MDAIERRKRAAHEAAEWFVRLQTDNVPREERASFVTWLQESQLHVAELLRVAQVHGALGQFERWAHLSSKGRRSSDTTVTPLHSGHDHFPSDQGQAPTARPYAPHEAQDPEGLRRTNWSFRLGVATVWAAAAAAVVAVAVATLLPVFRGQIIETERGERREVALADGSTVQVDPESRLQIRFARQSREVFLDKGRALFHVAKNVDRPFLVQAEGTVVRALGTEFGVDRQKLGVVVTVREGKVAVFNSHPLARLAQSSAPGPYLASASKQSPRMLTKSPLAELATPQELLLTADQQVKVQSSGSAEPIRTVDSGRELAWAEGRLVFDNQTVAAAIEQFNRYNRVQLRVTDESLARRPVSAVFNASEPESFIAFIQSVAPVHLVRSDQDITFAPSGHSPER